MASYLVSNLVANPDRSCDSTRRKKKKKIQPQKDDHPNQNNQHNRWKSEAQQQIYSSKLIRALSQVRIGSTSSASSSSALAPNEAPRRGRAVREAADRVLAVAAKGITRWSRAILTNRLKLKFMKHKRQRVTATGNFRSKKPRVAVLRLKGKSLPAVQRKVRVLGRLVPGCRKQPLPVILDEATDYIAALEMQIRAMSAVAEFLSAASSSSASAPPS